MDAVDSLGLLISIAQKKESYVPSVIPVSAALVQHGSDCGEGSKLVAHGHSQHI